MNRRKVLGILAAVLLLGSSVALTSCNGTKGGATNAADLRGGETRATLSPENFTGLTRDAYRIAREIPEVLDSLHCYCECKKHFGHKSLLTCYVDEHAKYCDICMDEAFMANELHRQGLDIVSIRKAVDERYSKLGH